MTKRTTNTQGVQFTYVPNGGYIKVFQLNNRKRFKLHLIDALDVLETIEHFLNTIREVESFSLVVNNTARIQGYLFSIDSNINSFLDLEDLYKRSEGKIEGSYVAKNTF